MRGESDALKFNLFNIWLQIDQDLHTIFSSSDLQPVFFFFFFVRTLATVLKPPSTGYNDGKAIKKKTFLRYFIMQDKLLVCLSETRTADIHF